MDMISLRRTFRYPLEVLLVLWTLKGLPKKARYRPYYPIAFLALYTLVKVPLFYSVFPAYILLETCVSALLLVGYILLSYEIPKKNGILEGMLLALILDAAQVFVLKFFDLTNLSLPGSAPFFLQEFLALIIKAAAMRYLSGRLERLSFALVHPYQIAMLGMSIFAFSSLRCFARADLSDPLVSLMGSPAALVTVASLLLALSILNVIEYSVFSYERHNMERLEWALKSKEALFNERQSNEAVLRRVYHDLKHYSAGLEGLQDEGGVPHLKGLLRSIFDELQQFELSVYTNHPTLDAILSQAWGQARQEGVQMHIYADFSKGGFIKDIDLCAIFGNALDNALEAAKQVQDPEKRMITVKAMCRGSFLIVNISNYYETPLCIRGDVFFSTKPEADKHGLGLQSIRSSVEKYNGEMNIDCSEGLFSLRLMIPCPEGTNI